ncbi:MAG: helix-turn-helix domain-containing protein [Streptomycetaceae bacterium]|nr:helix-turn-helix domain-containing protein [Streptomycetaceae bacterium]
MSSDQETAHALYQALRDSRTGRRDDVAELLGLGKREAARGWSDLEQLQLVRRSDAEPDALVPVDPEAAFLRLLDAEVTRVRRHQEEALLAQGALETLSEHYVPLGLRPEDAEVELLTDERRSRQALEDLKELAQREVVSMHPGQLPPADVLHQTLENDRRHMGRGVRVRALYSPRAAAAAHAADYVRALIETGADVRLCSAVPMHMVVGDHRLALLPFDPQDLRAGTIVVRGPALIRSYVTLYEYCWNTSALFGSPAAPAPAGDVLSDEQLLALRMLAAGMKDEKIARSLGVSLRTASRLLAGVMQELGAESRFQAGLKAAQLGWLE